MHKTHCYSVRLKSLTDISPKAYKATGWDGSECILPKSQVFGKDWDVSKSDAYWIASWILEQKDIQFSNKKEGWWNPDKGRIEPVYSNEDLIIEKHIPERKEPIKTEIDKTLLR